MKLLLDIKDDKASLIIALLKEFKFVKATTLSNEDAAFLEGLKDSVEQVQQAKNGKVKLKSTRQLLDEI